MIPQDRQKAILESLGFTVNIPILWTVGVPSWRRDVHGSADLVEEVRHDQCTLVPVKPGEITSQAGWPADTAPDELTGVISRLKAAGVRVSLFVDAERKAMPLSTSLRCEVGCGSASGSFT